MDYLSDPLKALRLSDGDAVQSSQIDEQTDSGIVDCEPLDVEQKKHVSTGMGGKVSSQDYPDSGFVGQGESDGIANETVVANDRLGADEVRRLNICKSVYRKDHASQVPAMFEQDVDGENDAMIALMNPDLLNQEQVIALLVDNAPDTSLLNLRNKSGRTALIIATLFDNHFAIRRLRLAGADPNLRDCHGYTAVHHAVFYGNREALLNLTTIVSKDEIRAYQSAFDRKVVPVDVNIRNWDGKTPLFIAAERRQIQVISVLKNMRADPNVTENSAGRTPLHVAVQLGYLDVVAELLKFSEIDVNAFDYAERTPLDCTLHLPDEIRQPIVNLLLENHAEYHYQDSDMEDCE